MNESLKPCPFCGGKAKLLIGPRGISRVVCSDCHCQTEDKEPPIVNGEFTPMRTEAINAWNTRKMPQSVIDALEKMANRMYDWLEMCGGCPADDYCGLEGSRPNSEQCTNAMAKAMARAAGWEV